MVSRLGRRLPVPAAVRVERRYRLRRAIDYAYASAHLPIGSRDVADAAGLHPRTLQSLVKTHLGTTPSRLLRDIRLDRARSDLIAGTRPTVTVQGVARVWHFRNLGRFSALYAARFGELPRETLRRARG